MIEKKRPRKLNSSKDSRVRGSDEMYDAVNIQVSSDYEGDGSDVDSNPGGNLGVIKAAQGNQVETLFEYLGELDGFDSTTASSLRVLGSVVDNENDIIYYFVWSPKAVEHGIYAYDPNNYIDNLASSLLSLTLPDAGPQVKAIYKSPLLNFQSDGFIKADVVNLTPPSSDFIVDTDANNKDISWPTLYFTDGVNEPRKVDVVFARASMSNSPIVSQAVDIFDGGSYDSFSSDKGIRRSDYFDQQDFLHVCPKTPVHPIKASFKNDFDTRTSNFEGISGYQFAYQYLYTDGRESALSTYSDIIVPPAYLQQGAKASANLSQTNICRLKIPRGSVIDSNNLDENGLLTTAAIDGTDDTLSLINRYIPKNVESIRILIREGNTGAFSVIDKIKANTQATQKNDDDRTSPVGLYQDLIYEFRNDRLKTGFPKSEADKSFDNVPQVAGAQVIASDRLMYGDYITGYDTIDAEATATITYNNRPEDFKSIDITVRPTIDILNQDLDVNNRKTGIYFDVDSFPSDEEGLSNNTTIDFTFTVRPKRNWHIYNSNGSFHGSRHVGNISPDPIEGTEDNVGNANEIIEPYQVSPNLASDGISGVNGVNNEPSATGGQIGSSRSRTNNLSNTGLNTIWGRNNGVTLGGFQPKWKTVASQAGVNPNDDGTISTSTVVSGSGSEVPVRYGTSAANPFILRGRPLLFSLSLRLKTDLAGPNYKKILREFITRAITWDNDPDTQASHFDDPNFYDENGVSPFLEILDIKNEYSYSIDEGIDGGDANSSIDDVTDGSNQINVTTNGDDRKHLIIAVGNGNIVNENASSSDLENLPPCGYFIVNKARPTFRLTAREDLPNSATYGVFQIDLRSLEQVETLTCVPFVNSDLWEDKGMVLNAEDGPSLGPENSQYWAEPSIVGLGNFAKPDNWGLRDVSVWQFQTMVVESWYCFSKQYLNRRPMPEFLFTSLYSDYARYMNGPYQLSEQQISDLGLSDTDPTITGNPGDLNPEVTNNGVLKNAAVLKQSTIAFLIQNNAGGLGGETDSAQAKLHFRHNMRLRVGGDGFYPGFQNYTVADTQGAFYPEITPDEDRYEKTRARIIGWIDSGQGYLGDESANIYNTGGPGEEIYSENDANKGFTILDGAGGIGANPTGGEATLRYDKGLRCTMGSVNGMMIFMGYIGPRETILPSKIKNGAKPPFDLDGSAGIGDARYSNYFNKFGQDSMMPFLGQFNYTKLSPDGGFMFKPGQWPNNDVKALYYTTPLNLSPGEAGYQDVLDEDDGGYSNHDWRDDFRDQIARNQPVLDVLDVGGGTILADEIRSGARSFKTRANHSFGIVYYDERGRAGKVSPISIDGKDSLYVQGYDEREGEDGRGRVSIKLTLDDAMIPSWARHYQIVYGGNSSVLNFVQYSTGGAFVSTANEGEAEQDSQNIYVSLNYLQGNKDVSYTEAFGAVSPSGTKQMYVHSPGDKLRVISYFLSNPFNEDDGTIQGRVFPENYEFEIVGVETLSANPESNPLRRAFSNSSDSAVMSDAKTGQFLVLKNNPFAAGFSYNDVKNGENDPSSNSHFWNNICVVEIFSPLKEAADDDQRLFFETGQVYDIGVSDGSIQIPIDETFPAAGSNYYKTNPVLLEKGDVWFRRVPLAVPKFDTDPDSDTFGRFRNLITYDKDNEIGSTPRFENYFLETQAFNDTFSGNDVLSKGKPNIIDDDFVSGRKKASITFSDKHVYGKPKVRFSSFKELSFKDLPAEHGPIRYLMDNYDSIVMIQESKTSSIPVERSILSTADGSNSLVQNKEPLGIQTFYAGDYGCDKNPESVIKAGGAIYFASPKTSEVYRLSPTSGIEVISSMGLKSEFYKTFRYVKSLSNDSRVYVPTGYDPLNDEFLITVKTENFINVPGVVKESQGVLGPVVEDQGDQIFETGGEITTGCTFDESTNWNPFALQDDGSCFILGCNDATAINYLTPSELSIPVISCDDGSTTTYDKQTYQNPPDCACRFFNPCIFDAFSLIPDGIVNFKDISEYYNDLSGLSATVPTYTTDFAPNQGLEIFSPGVINNLGLDFVWTDGLGVLPPTSLNAYDSWDFENDVFNIDSYRFAVAAYTEGPDMDGYSAGDPAFQGTVQQIWDDSPDVELQSEGWWKDVDTGQPVWLAPWSLASHNSYGVTENLSSFNGSPDVCDYVGCKDPNALNFDSSVSVSCSSELPTGNPDDAFRTDGDDDGAGFDCPDGSSPCFCGECPGVGEDCFDTCCPDAVVTFNFYCIDFVTSETYGYTSIGINDNDYGLQEYLATTSVWDTCSAAGPDNPAGVGEFDIYTTNPEGLQNEVVAHFAPGIPINDYDQCGSQTVQLNIVNTTDACDEDDPVVEEEVDYYYWIDCCQYKCTPDDMNPDGGVSDCYNERYPSTEYSEGDLNPDFDYNPNLSGDQP